MGYTAYSDLCENNKKTLDTIFQTFGIKLCPVNMETFKDIAGTNWREFVFSGEPNIFYNGNYIFGQDQRLVIVLHELAHLIFLGNEIREKYKTQMLASFADSRWHGEEEGIVMRIQCYLADCLQDYGHALHLKEMENFGFGFGFEFFTAKLWYNEGVNTVIATKNTCKFYKTLHNGE